MLYYAYMGLYARIYYGTIANFPNECVTGTYTGCVYAIEMVYYGIHKNKCYQIRARTQTHSNTLEHCSMCISTEPANRTAVYLPKMCAMYAFHGKIFHVQFFLAIDV